jgi:peptidyl-prolyl cis-trans isomerase C
VPDDGALRRQVEQDLRFRRTMHDVIGPVPRPTEEDIARFYKKERRNFQRPETVHVAHIVKHVDETHAEADARAGIEAALHELEGGEPFVLVVERHSDCKGNGGDLGSFSLGKMVPEFEDVVFAMRPGERSPIFRTRFGFHIAEMRSRAPAGCADLPEVCGMIEQFLAASNEAQALQRATAALRAKADIRRISRREAERVGAQRAAS